MAKKVTTNNDKQCLVANNVKQRNKRREGGGLELGGRQGETDKTTGDDVEEERAWWQGNDKYGTRT